MDRITLIGIALGITGILLGQVIEGGHILSLVVFPAALIVFLGTAGAVMLNSTKENLINGLHLVRWAFKETISIPTEKIIAELVQAAQIARKESILTLESKLNSFSHPYMRNVFRYVVDGVDPNTLKDMFENEIFLSEEELAAGAKIWTDAGGYAPTIGILGAVLGLIHVMENLSDTSKLGAGIATAFVATVYGVGSANLLFLPLGNKIKGKIKRESLNKELIVQGAVGIVSGMNPYIIEEKLNSYKQIRVKDLTK